MGLGVVEEKRGGVGIYIGWGGLLLGKGQGEAAAAWSPAGTRPGGWAGGCAWCTGRLGRPAGPLAQAGAAVSFFLNGYARRKTEEKKTKRTPKNLK